MPVTAPARFSYLLLRVGVAFAFLYPAVSAVVGDPYTWLGYFPQWALGLGASVGLSDLVMLHAFGAVEVLIALWILSGWKIFWPSLAATAMLLGIVVFNQAEFPILFRDVTIACTTFALALMNLPRFAQRNIVG